MFLTQVCVVHNAMQYVETADLAILSNFVINISTYCVVIDELYQATEVRAI